MSRQNRRWRSRPQWLSVALSLPTWFFARLPSAYAHETGPPDVHHETGLGLADFLTALGVLGIALLLGVIVVRSLRRREKITALRWAGLSLLVGDWLGLVSLQNALAPLFPPELALAGKLVFLITLTYLGWMVLHGLRPCGRALWRERWSRRVFCATLLVYGGFLAYAMGLVGPPDPGDPPLPPEGFLVFFEAYGPLSLWPNLEWWSPRLGLYGAVSVGSGLLLGMLVGLMALNAALLVWNLRHRSPAPGTRVIRANVLGSGGATALAASTSFCCCCFPALYPVLALFLGSTAAQALSLSLVQASGWWFNLALLGMLLMLTWSIERSGERVQSVLQAT